jgi:hypothetical protein
MNLVTQAEIYGHSVIANISDFLRASQLLLRCTRIHLTVLSMLHNLVIAVISCRLTGVKLACVVCTHSYVHMMHSFISTEAVAIETWNYIHCIFFGVKTIA